MIENEIAAAAADVEARAKALRTRYWELAQRPGASASDRNISAAVSRIVGITAFRTGLAPAAAAEGAKDVAAWAERCRGATEDELMARIADDGEEAALHWFETRRAEIMEEAHRRVAEVEVMLSLRVLRCWKECYTAIAGLGGVRGGKSDNHA